MLVAAITAIIVIGTVTLDNIKLMLTCGWEDYNQNTGTNMWYSHEKMKTKSTTEDWEYHNTMLILQGWKLSVHMLGKSRLQTQIQDYRKGLSVQMQEQSVHGKGQREGRLSPGEFWAMATKSGLRLWKKESLCGSNLNLVLMGMDRNQTGKERLWFPVKNLEIREAMVHGNVFSDLQNSLTSYWMR